MDSEVELSCLLEWREAELEKKKQDEIVKCFSCCSLVTRLLPPVPSPPPAVPVIPSSAPAPVPAPVPVPSAPASGPVPAPVSSAPASHRPLREAELHNVGEA